MNNFALITNHTQKIVLLLKPCAIFVLFFIKSSSLKANKLHGVNNVKVLKLFKITLYLQLLSFLLYHLICSDIIISNLVRSHENPGPNDCNLKFFHWNLDSLTARNNTKISLIEAYNSVFNYDLIAVSELIQGLTSLLTMKTYRLRDLAATSSVAIIQVIPEYLAEFVFITRKISQSNQGRI